MRQFDSPLPIDDALPRLVEAFTRANAVVLVAPPGAGKTTRVSLVLLDEPWAKDKKILLLEPRRLAARAAASRMAATLGEQVGDTVGLRVRFGSKISRRTRIEVITEGVFTRLVLDDPSLDGVAAVLFDEFHERSLDADLGLALAREVQEGLRDDLKVLVMSATLDGARVAALLGSDLGDAPVVTSEGRAYPVETRYLSRDPRDRIERPVADAVQRALRADPGSLLVFLPGAAEIRRTEALLKEQVRDPNVDIVTLFGALDARDQDRAISPAAPGRRKVVLATSIAETSLTIEGVRVVIDSGLSRVPRYEPDVGLTRLETVRVSRAAADQRRGRAGRTEPGVCYRLWDEPQTGSFDAYTRPEILSADLSSFVLDLAQWGAADASKLAFIDRPPQAAMNEAKALLIELGAIDAQGRITDEGRKLRQLPLPPRLARMVVDAGEAGAGAEAAAIAAILTERGLGGDDVDLRHRLDQFRRDRSRRAEDSRAMVKRWVDTLDTRDKGSEPSTGSILSLAYPDRVAKNRRGGTGGFVLANGRGGQVDAASNLAREPFLVVAELTGAAASSRIVLAAAITLEEIEERFADKIEGRDAVTFDAGSASLRARRSRRLGSVVLAEQVKQVTPNEATARILSDGIVGLGLDRLDWSKAALQFRTRVQSLRKAEGDEWPDVSDEELARTTAAWLEPLLADKTARSQISASELFDAVSNLVPWNLRRRLDAEAPTHFTAPTGTAVPIDYEAEQGPTVSIRVQELFGLTTHPSIAGGRVPLVIELLSPGHKAVQITRDLPGFWRGSYADVRSDLRGRYPRHPWPEDPTSAPPTRRAKPKGT
jgi:ATP-dependent helicase HrpB